MKRILNVTPAKEAGITAGVPNYHEKNSKANIKYKRISVYDASTSDLLSHADEIVDFIGNSLHHGSVLVHCQRGVSRSSTAVIMFLMRKANMTLDKSLKLCQRRRPVADPIPAFIEQLKAYEKECQSWGHLTSVADDDSDKKASGNNDIIYSAIDNSGEKRKAEDSSGDDGRKKRAVGPSIGPIGPVRPPTKPKGASDEKGGKDEKRVVGPAKRPPIGPMKPPSSSM